jgi:oligopeptide transport system substrate-binding protein
MYEEDDLDIIYLTSLPPSRQDRARQQYAGEYVLVPELHTLYVGFDVSRPPFDDRRVRQAFALATDKEMLADLTLRGFYAPATGGLVPPGMPGHSPGIGLPYDPEGARQLLAEAGYAGGRGFPVLDALAGGSSADTIAEFLQAQWLENLGIEIAWKMIEWRRLLDRVSGRTPHMWFARGWAADYPDPDSFLRASLWRVRTGWQDKAYDGLVEGDRRVMDQEERMRICQRADGILVDAAPILLLLYGRSHLLIKPWVKRYPTSPLRSHFWKDVVIEPH